MQKIHYIFASKLALIVLVVIAILVGAPGPSFARAAAPSGKLIWSIEGISELSTLDSVKATDSQTFVVINFLYGRLVKLDKDLKVAPDLASSWKISKDGLAYTFTLRNAKFSNGKPVTADDVLYSLNYAFDPKVGGQNAPYYLSNIAGTDDFVNGKTTSISGATAPDAKTVVLKISQPSAVFLNQLTFGFWVISKAQASTDPNWAQNPVASGGFSVKEWKHNQGITLVPNPGYWNQSSVAELDFQFVQDSETAYQLYKTGALDIMGSQQNGVPSAHIAEVANLPDFHQVTTLATRFVGFNNMLAPFDNVKVRQAFALAIDKKTLADKVLNGAVTAADRILPPGMPGSNLSIKPLSFDASVAKKALADAGFTAQSLPPITLTYGTEGDNERVLTILQGMWKDNLGVSIKLEPMELAKFSDTLTKTFQDPKNGIQMYYSIWGADYPDPQNFLSQQLQSTVGNNNGHWSDATFDKLTTQADALTTDDATRFKLYQQAEQIAIDKVGWLPVFFPKTNVLIRLGIKGVIINANGVAIPDYSLLKGR